MDFDEHYKELQELIKDLGITVTDDTKPTELFDAVIKLLAAYAAGQPDIDEIAEHTRKQLTKDVNSIRLSRGY